MRKVLQVTNKTIRERKRLHTAFGIFWVSIDKWKTERSKKKIQQTRGREIYGRRKLFFYKVILNKNITFEDESINKSEEDECDWLTADHAIYL